MGFIHPSSLDAMIARCHLARRKDATRTRYGAQAAKIGCGKTLKFADLLNVDGQEMLIVALEKDVRSSAPIFRRLIFANRNRGGQTNG
jgi:hypothetical protein